MAEDDIPFTEEEVEAADKGARARGANSEHGASGGAPPSNTAPHKCNAIGFLPLRQGIDSLYLTYKGTLKEEAGGKLERLKKWAQEGWDKHRAQYPVGDHVFTVSDKGRGHYHYVLFDGSFQVYLNAKANPIKPAADIRISSKYLSFLNDYDLIETELCSLLGEWCEFSSDAHTVSRADFYLDFCCDDVLIRGLDQSHFVSRAAIIRPYYIHHLLTGWDIGLGADLSARIYDKTLEIRSSGKEYLKDQWKEAGWDEQRTVWRIEFQVRRPVLAQYEIKLVSQLLQERQRLWTYFTCDWLQLKQPIAGDKTRSRWPVHPLWEAIQFAGHSTQLPPLIRRKPNHATAPTESKIMGQLISPLASLFAIHRIPNLKVGREMLYRDLPFLLKNHTTAKGMRLDKHLIQRVKEKTRQFNLGLNDDQLFDISDMDFEFPLEEEPDEDL